MGLDDLAARLRDVGLEERTGEVLALAAPSIRLTTAEAGSGYRSRLGGVPDLSAGVEWPRGRAQPLGLVAQLDLTEVVPHDATGAFPAAGTLSFFYEASEQPWGFDPRDRSEFRVIFSPEDASVSPRPAPGDLPEASRFTHRSLQLSSELTFPSWDSRAFERLGLSQEKSDGYVAAVDRDETTAHRLLGHPDPIQGEMQLECQLASNGVYVGTPDGYEDPRARDLEPGADDWMLLLQVDSDDAADMIWGDAGRLYYWIRKDDLAARRFAQAWLVLQCF